MTPGWAAELSRGGSGQDLVARSVRLAATAWVSPDRVRNAVAEVLQSGAAVTAAAVIEILQRAASAAQALADDASCEAAARKLIDAGATVLVAGERGYPRRLHDAWPELGAPLWVFVRSCSGTLPDRPAAAVVGTRQPTLDGSRTAGDLGTLLARSGVTVVSGMARGIDQASHQGALDGGGCTVGVLGAGFGVDYPKGDGALRDAVAASGGLVSELLPGTPPQKHTFLWRNRIISALADVTVVVEGRSGSGALHTARMAASQGRDVLAVPGSMRVATSRAPLELIRDGAQAMTRLDDVLEVLGVAAPEDLAQRGVDDTTVGATAQVLLPLLGPVPAPPGALAAATRQPIPVVMAAIAELTARGLAAATPRGVVRGRA